MNLKNAVVSALFGAAVLFPAASFAGPKIDFGVHIHSDGCGHGHDDHGYGRPPVGQPSQEGRYELRTVQRWVPGSYEERWVPEQCWEKRGHGRRKMKCRGGYYEKAWVEGRYIQEEQWVWVPVVYERRVTPPPPHRASVGIRVSTRL